MIDDGPSAREHVNALRSSGRSNLLSCLPFLKWRLLTLITLLWNSRASDNMLKLDMLYSACSGNCCNSARSLNPITVRVQSGER